IRKEARGLLEVRFCGSSPLDHRSAWASYKTRSARSFMKTPRNWRCRRDAVPGCAGLRDRGVRAADEGRLRPHPLALPPRARRASLLGRREVVPEEREAHRGGVLREGLGEEGLDGRGV